MVNSHYVPQLILKKFKDKLCLYNVKTGKFIENINVQKAYAQKGFYDDKTETQLNLKIESQFGNILANKLLKADAILELDKQELRLIKKFLLVSIIRSLGVEKFLQKEKRFYDDAIIHWNKFCQLNGTTEDERKRGAQSMQPPFKEKEISGETDFDYWMRTLNVILDTDGSPTEILRHPDKTYPAHRWATIIASGYLAFWDSEYKRDEFVITDIGMTSENEIGWNGVTVFNSKKLNFLIELLKTEQDQLVQKLLLQQIEAQVYFHENFEMFPISAKRMIVEISPFYKFRIMYGLRYKMPQLSYFTALPNERLYYPNYNDYKLPLKDGMPQYDKDDKYIYEIKKLSRLETRYCNELFLDRINTTLGFSSLNKAVGRIVGYKKGCRHRVDYSNLYKIIEERYGGNLNV